MINWAERAPQGCIPWLLCPHAERGELSWCFPIGLTQWHTAACCAHPSTYSAMANCSALWLPPSILMRAYRTHSLLPTLSVKSACKHITHMRERARAPAHIVRTQKQKLNENNATDRVGPSGRKLEGVHLANGYEEEGRRGVKIDRGRTGEGGWEASELYHNKFCTMAQQVKLKRVIFLLLWYREEYFNYSDWL